MSDQRVRVRPDGRVAGPLAWPDPPLTDGRLLLERFGQGDLPALVEACNDAEVHRWLHLPEPYTARDGQEFLTHVRRAAVSGAELVHAVRDGGGGLLGAVSLHLAEPRPGEAEVGYWVAAPARRSGVASAAVRLLAVWAFTHLPLRRIEILVDPANTASRGVAERAGAAPEGVRRAGIDRRGQRFDPLVYALLPADLVRL